VVVVVLPSDGGTTTVVFDGVEGPSPTLELHAATASMAQPTKNGMIFLCIMTQLPNDDFASSSEDKADKFGMRF
jgi:hypothetical protein